MDHPNPDKTGQNRRIINTVVIVVIAQVGVLTLAIVLGAVLGGLWLDNRFDTRPILTMASLVVSIPVSIMAMLLIVRKTVARIKLEENRSKKVREEENTDIGRE